MRAVGFLVAVALGVGILGDLLLGGLNNGIGFVFYMLLLGALIRYILAIDPKGEER